MLPYGPVIPAALGLPPPAALLEQRDEACAESVGVGLRVGERNTVLRVRRKGRDIISRRRQSAAGSRASCPRSVEALFAPLNLLPVHVLLPDEVRSQMAHTHPGTIHKSCPH